MTILIYMTGIGLAALMGWLFRRLFGLNAEPVLCKCCGHAVNPTVLLKNGCPKCGDFP